MPINPNKLGDWGTFGGFVLALIGGVLTFLTRWILPTKAFIYKTFLTREEATKTFVKIVEPDGSQNYVHPKQFEKVETFIDQYQKDRLVNQQIYDVFVREGKIK